MIFMPNGRGGATMIPTPTPSTSHTQQETQEVECVENCEPQQPQVWGYILLFGIIAVFVGAVIVLVVELWRYCKDD